MIRGFASFFVATLLAFSLLSFSVLANDFNITFSTPTLNSSTPNQRLNISIGNNQTNPGKIIVAVELRLFTFEGFTHIINSNFTSANPADVLFSNTTEFPMTRLYWNNINSNGLINKSQVANFSINVNVPLKSGLADLFVLINYSTGSPENQRIYITMISPPVNAILNLRGPANNSVYEFNDVNTSFNVTGDSSYYACLLFKNDTGPTGQQFIPAMAPPNFNVSNNTNTNITIFMPYGVWIWNVKCVPKDNYVAARTSTGYNVTRNGFPSSLNSFKVGDLVNFTNLMSNSISIAFIPPMAPPFSINLAPNASSIVDTSPDFSNPLSMKPPLMGPFSDNVSDQYSFGVLGGFGSSGDPRFSPGVFAAANFTLNVTGFARPSFDPSQFFNESGGGFNFQGGPCSPSNTGPKPPFCFQNASGGVAFNPNDAMFFDNHPDFAMTGFTDCSNPANVNQPDCKIIFDPNAQITGDLSAPNILFTKIGAFSDKLFLDFGTDEMSNMTVDYFGADSYCGNKIINVIDEGFRNPTTGELIQNSRFKPFHHFELGATLAANASISSNMTYYYKTNTCDKANNCVSSSSCKNFTSGITAFANAQVAMNFTIPSGFAFSFNFPNGTVMPITQQMFANNLTNMTMKFQPTGANWGIDLPASAISTNSSFDFSSAFKTASNGGKTYVGMNKTVWETLSQRLGITSINITIMGTGSTLNKCDDNGANCRDVTSFAIKQSTNSSGGTSTWTIPTTLGFSTYVDVPGSTTTTSSSSSGSGGSSSSTSTTKVSKTYTSIIPETPKSIYSTDFDLAGLKITQLDIYVKERVTTVTITVEKLSSRPNDISSDASGSIYQYFKIEKTNLDDSNVKKAVISFKVEKSWLDEKNAAKTSVSLYRYTNTWEKLSTKMLFEDNTTVSYEADAPGFSVFAIGSDAAPTAVQTTTTTTTTETTTAPPEATTTTTTQQETKISYSLIAVLLVSIVFVFFIIYRMKLVKI